LDDDKLTFDARVLEGDLAGADGPASVFVDIVGLPFTPLSYAGSRVAPRAVPTGMGLQPQQRRLSTTHRPTDTLVPITILTSLETVIQSGS